MGEVLNGRVLSLFYDKFLSSKSKNYHGLEYTVKLDDDGQINIDFKNPKKLSYNPEVLLGHVEELIVDFLRLFGRSSDYWDQPLFKTLKEKFRLTVDGSSDKQVYLNEKDLNKCRMAAKTIHEFKLEDFYSPCVVEYDYADSDGESILVSLKVKLLKPEFKGKFVEDDELKLALREVLYGDYGQDYEHEFGGPVLSVFWNNPLLIDQDYMWTGPTLQILDKHGRHIKWWDE